MAGVFLKIINMSISAGWIVLAVLVLRFFFKKAPKWINVILWGIVGVRLVMPFSIESIFSLMPSDETISKAIDSPTPHFESGFSAVDNQVNDYLRSNYFEGVTRPEGHFADITTILAIVWIIGIVALFIYTVIGYLRLRRKIGTAVLLRDNIFQSENVGSPFVLGIILPKIYLPFEINEQELEYVIAHENAHIKRKDHWWKPIGFFLLTLHWFNPLMWIGYIMLCRDIELACDEKVIKELNNKQKADYSQALLNCSVNRRMIAACPIAFGEIGVKDRVKSVLNYRKPALWIIIVAVIISIAVAVCFLTNPKKEDNINVLPQINDSEMDGVTLKITNTDLSATDPFIDVEWTNNTSEKIIFGDPFTISFNENGQWTNCSIYKDSYWNAIGYLVEPDSTTTKRYKLRGQNMPDPGKYKFEASFNIDGKPETDYTTWIEFELDEGVASRDSYVFEAVELTYDDKRYSFIQRADAAPTYIVTKNMKLFVEIGDDVPMSIGTFEEVNLNENNFDSRFCYGDSAWRSDDTLESLKENNKRLWQLHVEYDGTPPLCRIYVLIEQKDGTFYIGEGYYNVPLDSELGNPNGITNSDDSHIRVLYKLKKVDKIIELPSD